MNKIIVPVDYSEGSKLAFKYACLVALNSGAEITLLHCSHVPLIPTETPLDIYDSVIRNDEFTQLQALNEYKTAVLDDLGPSYENIKIIPEQRMGFAVDEITELSKEKETSLIIMGTKEGRNLPKVLMGSITARVIEKSACPVLSVPESTVFEPIKKIVFATDFHVLKDVKVLSILKEFCQLFSAELFIFCVLDKKEEKPSQEQALAGLKLENALEGTKHDYFFAESDDIIDAIENFIDVNGAQLLVMMPHHHNYFELLFGKSITREMSYHTHIPLLTLPEKIVKE